MGYAVDAAVQLLAWRQVQGHGQGRCLLTKLRCRRRRSVTGKHLTTPLRPPVTGSLGHRVTAAATVTSLAHLVVTATRRLPVRMDYFFQFYLFNNSRLPSVL